MLRVVSDNADRIVSVGYPDGGGVMERQGVVQDHIPEHLERKLKDCEIALLEKIAQEIEQTSFCSLNYNELKLLQEIINAYSNKRLKRKM